MTESRYKAIKWTGFLTLSAMMASNAVSQPLIGPALTGGESSIAGALSADQSTSPTEAGDTALINTQEPGLEDLFASDDDNGQPSEEALPGLEPGDSDDFADDDGDAQRVDGAIIVQKEVDGEQVFGSEEAAEINDPSLFLRYTLSEDPMSLRGCAAAGDICRFQFSAVNQDDDQSFTLWVNDEQVIPPEEDGDNGDDNGDFEDNFEFDEDDITDP